MDEVKHVKLAFVLGMLFGDIVDEINLESFCDVADAIAESINTTNKVEGDVWGLGRVTTNEVKKVLETVLSNIK